MSQSVPLASQIVSNMYSRIVKLYKVLVSHSEALLGVYFYCSFDKDITQNYVNGNEWKSPKNVLFNFGHCYCCQKSQFS